MLTQELNIRFQELEEHFRVRARTGVRGRGGEKFEVLVTLLSPAADLPRTYWNNKDKVFVICDQEIETEIREASIRLGK